MRFSSLPLSVLPLVPLLSSVRAQGQGQNQTQGSNSTDYGQECVKALQDAGFTSLASLFSQVNGTETGQALLSELSNGENYTLFAPDNEALQNVPSSVSGNNTLLAEYLSYHILTGDFQNVSYTNSSGGGAGGGGATMTSSMASSTESSSSSSESSSSSSTSVDTASAPETPTATAGLWGGLWGRQDSGNSSSGGSGGDEQPFAGVWPNVTIGRTLLNSSNLVSLEGNKSQVLAWTRNSEDANVTILNQGVGGQNVTVVNATTWRNLFINGITGVLVPPGNLSTALTAVNATSIQTLLSGAGEIPARNGTNESALSFLEDAHGVTVFLPNNAAFTSDVNTTLDSLQGNQSAFAAILENHYLNGTTLYSTEITNSSQFITAGGEPISFSQNDTGIFVSGANGTSAQIVRPDVLIKNGVVHIIDRVFVINATDPTAAQSAYASATSQAAVSTTETAPITVLGGGAGGAMSTQSSGESSSSSESSATSSSSSESSSSTESSSSSESTQTSSETSTSGGGGGGGGQSTETATATGGSRVRVLYQATNAASNMVVEPYVLFSVILSVVSGIVVLSV